jgi:hypothetical protein
MRSVSFGWICLALVAGLPASLVAQQDSVPSPVPKDSALTPSEAYLHVRGLERAPRAGGAGTRAIANTILFLPRSILSGALYFTGLSAHLVDNGSVIGLYKDFFYFYEDRVGWTPVLVLGSSDGIAGGARAFYRAEPFGVSAGGYYGGSEFYGFTGAITYNFLAGRNVWWFKAEGAFKKRQDYEFYGLGSDPLTDPRNSYEPTATAPFGLYAQRVSKAKLIAGLRPSDRWEVFLSSLFRDRALSVPGTQDTANIDRTFDLATVPGISSDSVTVGRQIYNELIVRYDSREIPGMSSPGVRVEAYGGGSLGVGSDASRFTRGGIDAAAYIPVIKRNRLLVPRMALDVLENLNDSVEISFAEYPRHNLFRGVATRTILRADNVMVQPSLEYQWPLSYNLRSTLFLDYLLVAQSVDELTFSRAPYAYGLGLVVHGTHNTVAAIGVTNGSEGFRFLLTIGAFQHTSDRYKWD